MKEEIRKALKELLKMVMTIAEQCPSEVFGAPQTHLIVAETISVIAAVDKLLDEVE